MVPRSQPCASVALPATGAEVGVGVGDGAGVDAGPVGVLSGKPGSVI
jgi:hypothetical protein